MIAFHIVLRNNAVVLDSGFIQEVCGVGLLKKSITDVFFISKNLVDGAGPPFCFASAGEDAVCFQTFCNPVHRVALQVFTVDALYHLRLLWIDDEITICMDDERLKRGTYLTEKYFDEQLERIREIRASERKFYQKITDLYATAVDYDKNSATTRRFYATVQNKMHYAVHGHTAAELIVERADHTKEHMGLTTWADAPEGKIKKSDVTVAKNYLSQDEMKQLNRMVTAYLDFAENMTLRHIPLTMQDWEKRLNSFIEMFDYGILQDAGKVSAEIAKLHAETEFEKYRVIQDRLFMSDFDKYMLELEENAKK